MLFLYMKCVKFAFHFLSPVVEKRLGKRYVYDMCVQQDQPYIACYVYIYIGIGKWATVIDFSRGKSNRG